MSDLRRGVENYLATRRALGFKLEREGRLLPGFVEQLEQAELDTITIDAALAWATQPSEADRRWWAARLAIVRSFSRWWVAFDPATEVPPADLLPTRSQRAEPYPYSEDDINALMGAAGAFPHPLRAATYQTLIGLLVVTGMRVGEAIALDRDDVDWDEGLIVLRHTKFDKSREVVLHPSTAEALRSYTEVRQHHVPRPVTPAFFVSLAGTRLIYNNVHFNFHQLVGQIGLAPRTPRCRPRIHDLRHRFAVTTLLGWYRNGDDVEARMVQLSTYLGHVAPSGTYWYLHAAPELLAMAVQRLEVTEESAP